MGITFAIFSFSGNIPEFKIRLIIILNGLVSGVLIRFMSWYDKSSLPRLVLLGKLSIICMISVSSILWKLNIDLLGSVR